MLRITTNTRPSWHQAMEAELGSEELSERMHLIANHDFARYKNRAQIIVTAQAFDGSGPTVQVIRDDELRICPHCGRRLGETYTEAATSTPGPGSPPETPSAPEAPSRSAAD